MAVDWMGSIIKLESLICQKKKLWNDSHLIRNYQGRLSVRRAGGKVSNEGISMHVYVPPYG